ncbi:polyphenol oxidase I, chloroplastic-like [Salvia miltiorrhiza]|uniref:polyphenol oxidase I, chloroplastic-like n=1 Tax=Salvia miltiorrhiza TaxID=226208 RepID=UPI0025ACA9B8|nr:polyphenol oxidase I, chloroplastic-like [Salvia miltiorrhiza]
MSSVPLSTVANISSQSLFSRHKPPRLSTQIKSLRETNNGEEPPQATVDRRNLLLGIGGLYGASNLVSGDALATPIPAPDLAKCSRGTNLNLKQPLDVDCCPPFSDKAIDYKLPPAKQIRVRPAAHLADKDFIAKYEKATELMKALPADDPRNFMQQANVHCAYCNLTYDQASDPSNKLQIHFSWLFFPWHRWYLYFYERILAKLIDDPTFALPFWNWDNPKGMPMPAMFVRDNSPLYNARRNRDHLPLVDPPPYADLRFSKKFQTDPDKIVGSNLTEMYSEMVRSAVNLEDFYGAKYALGSNPDPGAGTVERGSHTAIHAWVGDPNSPAGEDMGNFYSTGRDPLFFCHHANVDRMWSVWRDLRGPKPKDFNDPDWLDTSFFFYDENAQLVRVKVRDTLDNLKMGYTFQKVEIPWLNKRPKARVRKSKVAATSDAPKATDTSVFPVKLDKVVRVLVDRPKKKRSSKEKQKEEELLVIEGIEVDTSEFVRFEVFVNDEDDDPRDVIDLAEYAGGYSQVPHKNAGNVKSKIRLGLTELLEDLDVEDDDQILVSLVPRDGGEDITIGGVKIIYV